MEKLATLTRIVKEVLTESPQTRGDDGELVICVFEKLGIDSWHSLEYLVETGQFHLIRSIIRTRGRVQQEYAELCDAKAEARRKKHESVYRAYARSYLSEILEHEGEGK